MSAVYNSCAGCISTTCCAAAAVAAAAAVLLLLLTCQVVAAKDGLVELVFEHIHQRHVKAS
jgi:hypothetical protein